MRIYPYIFFLGAIVILVGVGMFNALTILEGVCTVFVAISLSLEEQVNE